ncbi:hypothetical protein CV014_13405 [Nostoc sp. CMAA1605]|nr:hypothetical protein [Nostoc sp. CMAA1605]
MEEKNYCLIIFSPAASRASRASRAYPNSIGGLGIGDWRLGIGDWGLGIGDWKVDKVDKVEFISHPSTD